jgi:hypothetical protein
MRRLRKAHEASLDSDAVDFVPWTRAWLSTIGQVGSVHGAIIQISSSFSRSAAAPTVSQARGAAGLQTHELTQRETAKRKSTLCRLTWRTILMVQSGGFIVSQRLCCFIGFRHRCHGSERRCWMLSNFELLPGLARGRAPVAGWRRHLLSATLACV